MLRNAMFRAGHGHGTQEFTTALVTCTKTAKDQDSQHSGTDVREVEALFLAKGGAIGN